MPVATLRIAPSGAPVVGDPSFAGLQLRLAESVTSVILAAVTATAMAIETVTPSAEDWTVSLDEPSPTKQYKVEAVFYAANTLGTPASMNVVIQGSYDAGATWVDLANSRLVNSESNQVFTVTAALPTTLGSALDTPMPATAASFAVRVQLQSTDTPGEFGVPAWGDQGNVGRLSLYELA